MKQGLIILLAFVLHAAQSRADRTDPTPEYLFTLTWDYWDGSGDDESVNVTLNGRSIGGPMSAFKELEGLSFERGTAIKIEFPVSPEKSVTREPIYCYSSFLHRWLERGAVIDVYENGKRLNAHWVSWRDLYDVKGNYVKSMDDVTWVADGKRLGKGGALLSRINQWRKEPDVLIQVLTPFRWDPSDIHLGIAYPQLLDPRKFRVFVITPEAKDLFGSGAK